MKYKILTIFVFMLLILTSIVMARPIPNTNNQWYVFGDNSEAIPIICFNWTGNETYLYPYNQSIFYRNENNVSYNLTLTSGGVGGCCNPFDQNLNTTDDVTFNSITGDGSGLTNLPIQKHNPFNQDLNTTNDVTFNTTTANTYFGDGGNLTNITASGDGYAGATGHPHDQDLNTTDDVTFNTVVAGNLNIANWNTAYGWGDHSIVGYLTSQLWFDQDLNTTDDVTFNSISGDGSGLTNLPIQKHNPFDQDLNTTDDVTFNTVSAGNLNIANWDTAYGWGNHAIQNYFDKDTDDTDDINEGSTNFWCDLSRIQSECSNDFHNIGGTDDDIPESGDFGNAGDLNADGTITDGVIDEADLDCDNSPTDEYVLTYESSTGNFEWEADQTGGGGSFTYSDWFNQKLNTTDDVEFENIECNAINYTGSTRFVVDVSNNDFEIQQEYVKPSFILNQYGIVTMAYQPSAKAYRSYSQNLNAGGGWQKILFNAESYDQNNDFDSTINNRFVCPTAGIYLVAYSVTVNNFTAGNSLQAYIYKNGALAGGFDGESYASTSSLTVSGTDMLHCSSSDYIELYLRPVGGFGFRPTTDGAGACYISITKIA